MFTISMLPISAAFWRAVRPHSSAGALILAPTAIRYLTTSGELLATAAWSAVMPRSRGNAFTSAPFRISVSITFRCPPRAASCRAVRCPSRKLFSYS
ncbi:hypothetical protein BDV39DRAFT_173491 [Aspergillus sergii]|uniref:Uncharacterized protein n=1 Tax=Aspergillus sergii TaxID=1034303 RepID=A0A5N6X5T1_9EURO|nr:hypothetical protein BDV39DRAFT_173491 [Aspergillus sergii]